MHIWKDDSLTPRVPMHSGQIMVDRVSYVCEALSNISNQPTEAIKEWCADKVAPTYWKPNSEIIVINRLLTFLINHEFKLISHPFYFRIVLRVRRILKSWDCANIIAEVVEKVFVIFVVNIECQFQHANGWNQFVSVMIVVSNYNVIPS